MRAEIQQVVATVPFLGWNLTASSLQMLARLLAAAASVATATAWLRARARVRDEALALQDALDRWGLDDVVIPTKTVDGPLSKTPCVRHKQGWDAECARRFFRGEPADSRVGLALCLRSMIVLDFDTEASYDTMLRQFPALGAPDAPRARTAKGWHVLFRRTPELDALGVWDKARCLTVDGVEVPVDVKTRASTGTGGILAVYPSAGKEWVVDLKEVQPPPMPDGLVRWLDAHQRRERPGAAAAPPRSFSRPPANSPPTTS